MKRTVFLLLCFFLLATFQFSFANASSNIAEPSQVHTFSTPEQTWNLFKTAILKGDFDTAHHCCSEGKTKAVLKFKKMEVDKRKRIVQSMQELEKIHQQDNKAKYKLLRTSKGANFSTFVYFEKVDNEWKIESY
jgi:hypothetical protein